VPCSVFVDLESNLQQQIRGELEAIEPLDELESEHLADALAWVDSGAEQHPRLTVERELQEELGFKAAHAIQAPLMVTCTTTVGLTAGHVDVSLWYLVHADRTQSLNFDETEFNAVRWFRFSEIPFERGDPHLRRFVTKLVSKLGVPGALPGAGGSARAEAG